MKLGMVTYQLGVRWDLDTLLNKCHTLGFEGVELRTGHQHGVEPSLYNQERVEVKNKFADSPVKLLGLGSTCEYHSPDPAILEKNISETKEFVLLAKDVGAEGVKVRPNGIPPEVPVEKTLEQIGLALREVSAFASDYGVKIWLEMHGKGSSSPIYTKQMMDIASHPNFYICWNSNQQDLDETGSIEKHFNLLKEKISLCHIHELSDTNYPWLSLFSLLQKMNYQGYCMAEVNISTEPERYMKNYKALFNALNRIASELENK